MLHSFKPRASGHRRQRAGKAEVPGADAGEGDRRMPMAVRENVWMEGQGQTKRHRQRRGAGRGDGVSTAAGQAWCSKGRPGASVPSPSQP